MLVRDRAVALTICGLAAPFVYAAAAITASLKYPGYDHLKNFVSELGASGSPSAGIMNLGFFLYGLLVALLALAIHRGIRPDAGGVAGTSHSRPLWSGLRGSRTGTMRSGLPVGNAIAPSPAPLRLE